MATIPEITDRLEAATEKAENASQIMYDVANGDASTEVPTASGPTPALKKWFQDLGSEVEPMLAGIPARLDKAVLVYQTKAEADAAAATLPDGQIVEAPDAQGKLSRYIVQSGALVFQRLLSESVSVTDFGAVGNGITNDTPAIQAALNSLGSGGGTVNITRGMKCLVDTPLVVPANCSLVGPHVFVGSPQDNASAPYQNLGGALIVNSSATITMKGGSGLSGLLIYRNGMTFPATDTSQFAGVAVTANGDDVVVQNSMILGFNKAYYSNGYQRARIHHVYMDNINGIDISQCYDIAYVTECHCWPFATIALSGATLIRSGIAYYFHNGGDWNKLTNCFSYGYRRGLEIQAANSITATGCGFDNVPGGHPGSIGISVTGGCEDTKIINCQTAAQANAGIFIDNSGGSERLITTIQGHNVWGGSDHGVLIYGGDVLISGSGFRGISNVVSVTTAESIVNFDNNWTRNIIASIINASVATANVHVGPNNEFLNFTGAPTKNLTLNAVASATAIQIPSTGQAFYVTGTTGFGTLRHAWPGRVVTLLFTDNVSVFHSTSGVGSMQLNNKATFAAGPGSSITLIGVDGESWVEIGRSG